MEDTDVDRYLKESCRSFREAKVKNSARRNSLMKKTLGIENERKMATVKMSREEKQLREQLRQMQMGKKVVTGNAHKGLDKKTPSKSDAKKRPIPSCDVDPYPVTFADRTPSPHRKGKFEEKGRLHAARRQRRTSREFEDLRVNTTTGKLLAAKTHSSKLLIPSSLSPSIARRLIGSQNSMSSSDDLTGSDDPEVLGSERKSKESGSQQDLRTKKGKDG
ncbi:uncharacterized protein LOC124147659 [Haliotis rufescens]|uniref:uncharacterized protein LOC124147659 n=1 Tax=Haliotis rufescens TaxID=6454 RepID=UPI00201F117B|nr:uncharacterized protein LOC124147659 [Haliotis rufescens]XP_048236691.1 uncharacterized protein LOC124147659 [Haliotis rufescens]XP_048236692.1 uncharacterized protein LOC124147659 [Haliotis rufescens]